MNKLFKRIMTIGMGLVMAAAVAVPAMAEDATPTGTGAAPVTATISVKKTVQAKVANEFPEGSSYRFTLKASGVVMGRTTGKQYTVTDMPMPNNQLGGTKELTVPVSLDSSDLTNKTQVGISLFDNISYENTGIYTYELTEIDDGALSVGYDPAHYYVNVYVVNEKNSDETPKINDDGKLVLKVNQITLYKGIDKNGHIGLQVKDNPDDEGTSQPPLPDATEGKIAITEDGTMEVPFLNKYPTESLVVSKTVTGNLGNPDQAFDFSIAITNETAYSFAYKIVNKNSPDATLREGTFKDSNAESGVHTFQLKHNEHLTLYGVPVGLKYTVKETNGDESGIVNEDGYTAAYDARKVAHETVTTVAGRKVESEIVATTDDVGVSNGNVNLVDFYNDKTATTPTGVLLRVAPFALLAVLLVAGIAYVAISGKRRKNGYQGL